MINWDKLYNSKIQQKFIIPSVCIISVFLMIFYGIIIHNFIEKRKYTKQVLEIVRKNEETIFSVEKIYLCSGANVIDTSSDNTLKKMSLYQYTDIAIYFNNYKEKWGISNKNTIKQLYIDNINLTINSNKGVPNLSYTNLMKIGDKHQQIDFTKHDRIDFNIVNNNTENNMANYDEPTFYADCSNPISLKYVNNLEKDYNLEKDKTISFDGSILKNAGISIEDINCKVKFKINIINNENNYFSCWINISLPLDEIYNGVSIKSATTTGKKFDFFQS